jgi:hypothetical protein
MTNKAKAYLTIIGICICICVAVVLFISSTGVGINFDRNSNTSKGRPSILTSQIKHESITARDTSRPTGGTTGAGESRGGRKTTEPASRIPVLASPGGNITTGAAEHLGLNPEQRMKAQEILKALLKSAEADLAARAVYDKTNSDENAGIVTYQVSASPDRGRSLLQSFSDNLDKGLGDKLGRQIYGMFDSNMLFGGFGKYDTEIKIFEDYDKSRRTPMPMIEYSYRDPETGDVQFGGVLSHEAFKENFGEAFVLPGKTK